MGLHAISALYALRPRDVCEHTKTRAHHDGGTIMAVDSCRWVPGLRTARRIATERKQVVDGMVLRPKRKNYRFGRNEMCFGCVGSRSAASGKRLSAFDQSTEQATHGLYGRWRRGFKFAELVTSKRRAIGATAGNVFGASVSNHIPRP